jgi:TonB family protein
MKPNRHSKLVCWIAAMAWLSACESAPEDDGAFFDDPPQLLNEAAVDSLRESLYPAELRTRGISGRAEVGIYITADSQTTRVRIVEGTGLAELDSAAVRVARGMRWRPALKDSVPVPAYLKLGIAFGPQSSSE